MKRTRLLLVEDDSAIALGLEYSLEQEDYVVTICNSVASAMDKIAQETYDLALLDISLPDGTGYDICKLLKKSSDTPVIFLTARDDEGSVVLGLDIETVSLTRSGGFAELKASNNYDKPYLYLLEFDNRALENLPVHLLSGRLPEGEDEIVISEHIKSNGGVNYEIGDTLTLELG